MEYQNITSTTTIPTLQWFEYVYYYLRIPMKQLNYYYHFVIQLMQSWQENS